MHGGLRPASHIVCKDCRAFVPIFEFTAHVCATKQIARGYERAVVSGSGRVIDRLLKLYTKTYYEDGYGE